MTIKLVKYVVSQDIVKAAQLALRSRLYICQRNWALKDELLSIGQGYTDKMILILAFVDEVPVGICLIEDEISQLHTIVFVKKKFRRQGIGSSLVEKGFRHYRRKEKCMFASQGVPGSNVFFQKTCDRLHVDLIF